jgi:ABC-type Fe3+/spermidine/putrescine transport system ATPase subunit
MNEAPRLRGLSSDEAIVVRGLGKRFGAVTALDGLDLSVRRGTVVGLLGPNGAGKTTAIRILTTILRADIGHATVLGLDVAREAEALRPLIGLAGQYAAVDENLNARENLRLIGRLCHQPRSAVKPRIVGDPQPCEPGARELWRSSCHTRNLSAKVRPGSRLGPEAAVTESQRIPACRLYATTPAPGRYELVEDRRLTGRRAPADCPACCAACTPRP